MEIQKRNVKQQIEKYYETVDLKNGVQIEKQRVLTYENEQLVSDVVSTYYKNNKVENGIIALFSKDVKELHRQHNIFHTNDDSIQDKVYDYIYKVPFDLVVEKGDKWEDFFDLLILKTYDHTLRNLDNIELPKRMFFDYMNGIRDGLFNLTDLLNHLKTIESVELLSGIEYVPYYNRRAGSYQHIKFIVRPTDKEWEDILNQEVKIMSSFGKKVENKVKEYFGFNKFYKDSEDDSEDDDYES